MKLLAAIICVVATGDAAAASKRADWAVLRYRDEVNENAELARRILGGV